MSALVDQCPHLKVSYRNTDGAHHCDECSAEFFHLDMQPGKLTVMEPQATLRDQFAMAALTGLLAGISPKEASSYPDGAFANIAYAAADDMLKERVKVY